LKACHRQLFQGVEIIRKHDPDSRMTAAKPLYHPQLLNISLALLNAGQTLKLSAFSTKTSKNNYNLHHF